MWAHLLVCQPLLPVLWHLWICRRYTLSHHPGHWLSCSIVVAALSAPGNTINDWTFFLRTQYFMTRSPPSFQPNSLSTYLAHISLVFSMKILWETVSETLLKSRSTTSHPILSPQKALGFIRCDFPFTYLCWLHPLLPLLPPLLLHMFGNAFFQEPVLSRLTSLQFPGLSSFRTQMFLQICQSFGRQIL